jgi:hypothetical protein
MDITGMELTVLTNVSCAQPVQIAITTKQMEHIVNVMMDISITMEHAPLW